MAATPQNKPKAADKQAKEPIPNGAATADPAVEQPAKVPSENLPEESPGPAASFSGQLRPGKLFAWFELQRELDNGRTGAVWLAQDYSVRRPADQVALKFLPDCIVSDKNAAVQLKNEIRQRIPLKHPNILRVFDLVESKGRVVIPMEYLDGQSLSQLRLTKPNQVFEVRDLEKWVKQLCEALEYAHKEFGLIDGDIGPGNLILDPDGNLKLKEFGLTNCISDFLSRLTGTPDSDEALPYKSPAAGRRAAAGNHGRFVFVGSNLV